MPRIGSAISRPVPPGAPCARRRGGARRTSSGLQLVQSSAASTASTPAAVEQPPRDLGEVEHAAVGDPVAELLEARQHLVADLVATPADPGADRRRGRAEILQPHARRSPRRARASRSAASRRRRRPASATGRQSATWTSGVSAGFAVTWPSPVGLRDRLRNGFGWARSSRRRRSRAVNLVPEQHAVARSRPSAVSEPRPVRVTESASSSVSRPRFSDSNRLPHAADRVENAAVAPGAPPRATARRLPRATPSRQRLVRPRARRRARSAARLRAPATSPSSFARNAASRPCPIAGPCGMPAASRSSPLISRPHACATRRRSGRATRRPSPGRAQARSARRRRRARPPPMATPAFVERARAHASERLPAPARSTRRRRDRRRASAAAVDELARRPCAEALDQSSLRTSVTSPHSTSSSRPRAGSGSAARLSSSAVDPVGRHGVEVGRPISTSSVRGSISKLEPGARTGRRAAPGSGRRRTSRSWRTRSTPAREILDAAVQIDQLVPGSASGTARALMVKSRRARSSSRPAGRTSGSAPGMRVGLRAGHRRGRPSHRPDRRSRCRSARAREPRLQAPRERDAASPATATSRFGRGPAQQSSPGRRRRPPRRRRSRPAAASATAANPGSASILAREACLVYLALQRSIAAGSGDPLPYDDALRG